MQASRDDVLGPDIVMVGHDEMRQQGLSLLSRTFDAVSRQPGKLPFDPIWSELAEDVELSTPRGFGAPIGQIDDHALFDTVDRSVRLLDEALQTIREPVIAPGLPATAVHALPDNGPVSVISDDEAVEIEVKTILDRRAIDLGDEPTRFRQRRAVGAPSVFTSRCDAWSGVWMGHDRLGDAKQQQLIGGVGGPDGHGLKFMGQLLTRYLRIPTDALPASLSAAGIAADILAEPIFVDDPQPP
jgi:hypothetical protein